MGGVLLKINSQQLQKPLAFRTLNDKSAVPELHAEVLERYKKLNSSLRSSF